MRSKPLTLVRSSTTIGIAPPMAVRIRLTIASFVTARCGANGLYSDNVWRGEKLFHRAASITQAAKGNPRSPCRPS